MSDIDIKERFGTGWIGTGSGSQASQTRSGSSSGWGDDPNAAVVTLGKQVVRYLAESSGIDRMYSLADRMKLQPQDLSPVIEWLANNYYVRVETEQFGNHSISLTDKAKELLSS